MKNFKINDVLLSIFNNEKLEYDFTVSAATTSITISADKINSKATVTGLGTIQLPNKETLTNIVVTAENGDVRTFKLKIVKNDALPYQIVYDSQGGSSIASVTLDYGSLISNTTPSKTGYIFDGWYKEVSLINAWNFSNDKVEKDTTLYAKWIPAPAIPTLLKADSSGYDSVLISWAAASGANGYEVYRSTSSTGTYTGVAATGTLSFNNVGLVTNSNYYYKVRAYKTVGTTNYYSGFSSIVSTKPIPAIPTTPRSISSGYNSIKTSWTAVSGASGYEVYRSTSSAGMYTVVATTASTFYNNISLVTNTNYYYKVRSYRLVGTIKVYSGFSNVVYAKPIPNAPASLSVARYSTTSIRVAWGGVSGASGYQVYRATTSTGTYSLVKTTTSWSTINTGLVKGRYYYYKVRAYRIVGTIKVYSGWTVIKSAKPY